MLPSLDKQLENKRYFCGEDVSIADIQYFCEISTIVNLTKRDLNQSDYPNLASWYNEKLSQIPEIESVDRKLKEIIAKYNFH